MSKLERIEHFSDGIQRAGNADIETAEPDCWRTLSNIEPRSKKVVLR
jgi:hypothetical protein